MTTADLVIRSGSVLIGSELEHVDVAIRGGVIDGFIRRGTRHPAERTLDAEGLAVLPGLVDAHVHFREPGFTHKEDFESGSSAAAYGGVTTVLDMPTTAPPVYDAATLLAKRDLVEPKSWVDFGLYGALDACNLDQTVDLADAGAVAFKVFMYERASAPPHGITNDSILLRAFGQVAKTGLTVVVHAESDELLRDAQDAVRSEGRSDALAHVDGHPVIAEAEAIQRAILFAQVAGARLHVAHISSAVGVRLVREARLRAEPVTAEVTPQHLLLDDRDYATFGAKMKMVPPIRSHIDREALWAGLVDGSIELIATDHAPHTEREKSGPILTAASGLIGVETTLTLMLNQVALGRLDLPSFSRLASEGAARLFGLYPRKGTIARGSDADLVVVDLDRPNVVNAASLHSRSRNTPFDGVASKGSLVYTLVRGQIVISDGQMVGRPGGRMVRPQRHSHA